VCIRSCSTEPAVSCVTTLRSLSIAELIMITPTFGNFRACCIVVNCFVHQTPSGSIAETPINSVYLLGMVCMRALI
jgi:hypothetical protein